LLTAFNRPLRRLDLELDISKSRVGEVGTNEAGSNPAFFI
jgi:hypothetical protein